MNNLKTTDTGGYKLEILNDLRWIDAGIRDAFKGIFSNIYETASDGFKISGCEVTINGNTFNWTAGYIFLHGEILKVIAGSLVIPNNWDPGEEVYWDTYVTYDPAGSKIFFNNITHDCYEIRNAKLFFGVPPTDLQNNPDFMPYSAHYYSVKLLESIGIDTIINKINEQEEDWQEVVAFANNWSNYGSIIETAAYKIDSFNVVHLKGVIIKGASNTSAMFQLPQKYRPQKSRIFNCIQIATDGWVHSNPLSAQVNLDGLSYKL